VSEDLHRSLTDYVSDWLPVSLKTSLSFQWTGPGKQVQERNNMFMLI